MFYGCPFNGARHDVKLQALGHDAGPDERLAFKSCFDSQKTNGLHDGYGAFFEYSFFWDVHVEVKPHGDCGDGGQHGRCAASALHSCASWPLDDAQCARDGGVKTFDHHQCVPHVYVGGDD